MLNIDFLFLFVFVFSILATVRLTIKFISALIQNPPQKLDLSGRELILNGLLISYLITYIITKI